MSGSMLFKFCYYNFRRFQFHPTMPIGTDMMRRTQIPHLDFTSKNWIIRIYRILPDSVWDREY
jgi:dolichyl-diphosphooligosaccharide--protein glycosyltransferase